MPNIKVKYIIDENGDRVAPVTHIDAVRDSSGNGLSEILEDKPDATDLSAVATSGDYSDLENAPTSESAVQDGTDLSLVTTGEKYIWNNKADNTAMVGATSSVAGSAGLVPAPAVADKDKFLKGDGTWGSVSGNDSRFVVQTGKFSVARANQNSNGTTYYYSTYYLPMSEADFKKTVAIMYHSSINQFELSVINNTGIIWAMSQSNYYQPWFGYYYSLSFALFSSITNCWSFGSWMKYSTTGYPSMPDLYYSLIKLT